MLSLMSLNFWQSRPLMSICVTKYWVLSLWQKARPSSISNCSAMQVSSTLPRWPLRAASTMTFSTDRTFAAKVWASRFSACTFAAASTTPATRKATGATHGSSLAKLRSAPPAALAAWPRAPRAPSLVAPATSVAAPAATVTAAVASTPVMPAPAALSSLDAFFFGAFGSIGAEDASFDAPQPISSATVGVFDDGSAR